MVNNPKEAIRKGTYMIYIFTALFCEAHILIRQFDLEKNTENTWFQEFYNETAGIRLTVTGVGEVAAAAAVGSVCSVYRPGSGDVLLNVGTCAYTAESDGIFLCNKITEQATGRTFYPDMLYRHNLHENAIVTGMLPWSEEGRGSHGTSKGYPVKASSPDAGLPAAVSDGSLYDMEAAAVYQAGSLFFSPHQMLFLKVVSDGGAAEEVSREQIERRMEKYQKCIFDLIGQISAITHMTEKDGNGANCLWQEDEALIRTFCRDLHCSKAMRDSMRQYIRYLSLAEMDYTFVIRDMYEKGLLPCKDKREGKLRFEEFKRRVF